MHLKKHEITKHIEHYAATGHIPDELIPFYDQYGKWVDAPSFHHCSQEIPLLKVIKSSVLPASRRTTKNRLGMRLLTSFIWRGDEDIHVSYVEIGGSLIVDGNSNIHAPSLRHVGGSFYTSTNQKVYLPNLNIVGEHIQIMQTFDVKLPRLRHVGGRAQILGYLPPRLESVGRSLGIYWCFQAHSPCLRRVGDYLILTKAESIRLPLLEEVSGSMLLTLLVKSIDVPRLVSIGGDFLAPFADDIRAPSLRVIGGQADTSSAKGFYTPRIKVGGEWTTYPGDVEDWHRREAGRKAMKREDLLL